MKILLTLVLLFVPLVLFSEDVTISSEDFNILDNLYDSEKYNVTLEVGNLINSSFNENIDDAMYLTVSRNWKLKQNVTMGVDVGLYRFALEDSSYLTTSCISSSSSSIIVTDIIMVIATKDAMTATMATMATMVITVITVITATMVILTMVLIALQPTTISMAIGCQHYL